MRRAYFRGHAAYYDSLGEVIRYCDTGELVYSIENGFRDNRPCTYCEKLPTPEGYDACIGFLPGVESACCGHGVSYSYVVWENGVLTDGLGIDGRNDIVSMFAGLPKTEVRKPRFA